MAFRFPSAEWVDRFKDEINTSKGYAEAASTWEGDFYFVVEPGPGVEKQTVLYVDLWHGRYHARVLAAAPSTRQPEFVISGSLPNWRQVIERKVDPIQALITRRIKLQGNMQKVMRAVKAAQELVQCTTRVPTEYPDHG